MTRNHFFVIAVTVSLLSAFPAAAEENLWDKINNSGELVCGALNSYKPTAFKVDGPAEYEGYGPNICRAMAKDLSAELGKEIKVKWRETTWQTLVLDIQSARIDVFPGMSATEERRKAINMAGPLYKLSDCVIHGKNAAKHDDWEGYNSAETKIAIISGSSQEQFVKNTLPQAQIMSLKQDSEAMLAVQSGRANIMVQGLAICLQTFTSQPKIFREISVPLPEHSVPSSAGSRKDGDDRFQNWLQAWSEKTIASQGIKPLMIDGFQKSGMDVSALPDTLKF